tara:strand:+ start:255 stop:386 length:132 start_codon:yes stop_codon:yes gene_type:complete
MHAVAIKIIEIKKKVVDLPLPTSLASGEINNKISAVRNKYNES